MSRTRSGPVPRQTGWFRHKLEESDETYSSGLSCVVLSAGLERRRPYSGSGGAVHQRRLLELSTGGRASGAAREDSTSAQCARDCSRRACGLLESARLERPLLQCVVSRSAE